MDQCLDDMKKEHLDIIRKVFNTAYFEAKTEMSFCDFPRLILLQKKNGSDLAKLESYCTDVACRRFV